VVKCRPHTGLAFYPTQIGRMHRGLKGRDYVKEMIDLCHENNIAVMAYFSQIFDNWAYEAHPSWRVINGEGKTSREYEEYTSHMMFRKGRYGIVCPNNKAYQEYVKACLTEMTTNYQFESIFLDMPFWSEVCYCPSCKEKYYQATGKGLPRTVDWASEEFRAWQAMREEWMGEFAQFATHCIKAVRPEVTIEHNMSVASAPWQFASTDLIADACDYVGGDLYGGYLEQTFICKYYRNLTKERPFVYITSRCDPGLSYHTTTKSEEELLLHAITALVHDGAFSICDGANPDGTICERVYTGVIKNVFQLTQHYEQYVADNTMDRNVSIWFPSRSKYDWKENGDPVCGDAFHDSFTNDFIYNPLRLAQNLREENIPFDVIPSRCLDALDTDVLAMCDVVNIRDEEMAAIEQYVMNGGNLYISGHIGHPRLLELLEARHEGMTAHNVTYMRPTVSGQSFFLEFDEALPMAVQSAQQLMHFEGDHEVLAHITLPYTMTARREFAAIHSNPPGIHTQMPAVVLKQVGKGKVLWVAAPIENARPNVSRLVVKRMIKGLCHELAFASNAPACVEILGWQKDGKQYFAAINQQETAPIAPMYHIQIVVPYLIKEAKIVEKNILLNISYADGKTTIELPEVQIFEMIEVVK
ncbi:MAG: family 10 glycosylhydrolase, partial [Cellulosilyticaceae bacterium]